MSDLILSLPFRFDTDNDGNPAVRPGAGGIPADELPPVTERGRSMDDGAAARALERPNGIGCSGPTSDAQSTTSGGRLLLPAAGLAAAVIVTRACVALHARRGLAWCASPMSEILRDHVEE